MPVAASRKPIVKAPLGTVAGTRGKCSPVPEKPLRHTVETGLFTADIFTISFNYLQQVVQMKVMKISYCDRRAIYKMVLGSDLGQTVRDCWLQHAPQGWVTVLGQGLADDLKRAITTAISFQEF
jgi:hypothetical protein